MNRFDRLSKRERGVEAHGEPQREAMDSEHATGAQDDELEIFPMRALAPTGSLTNPRFKYPFEWLVPWSLEERKAVLLQHLEAAEKVREEHLRIPTHESLERFVMLIQDDEACRLLDYSMLTRWIAVIPFLCACQQAVAGETASRSQVRVLQSAYHLWINLPRGPVRTGDLYLYEIWFCVLRAVIVESIPEALPRRALREYSDPDTLASIEKYDLTESVEFAQHLKGWKSEIRAWGVRAMLRAIRPRSSKDGE